MFKSAYAVLLGAVGTYWALWSHRRISRRWGRSLVGRFVAHWVATTCFALGLAGFSVLWNDGWHRTGGAYSTWYRLRWPRAIGTALAAGLLIGFVLTLQSTPPTGAPPKPSDDGDAPTGLGEAGRPGA